MHKMSNHTGFRIILDFIFDFSISGRETFALRFLYIITADV